MSFEQAMTPDDVNLLTSLLSPSLLGPLSDLHYGGESLSAPDGDLTNAINAIVADPNWKITGAKAQLRAYAASARYNKEVGGTTVEGVTYATDRETQAKLVGAYNLAQVNPNLSIDWKLPDGTFTTLNAAAITAAAVAVGSFVQQCFGAEAAIVVGINGGTVTTTAQIDAQLATF